MGRQVSAVPLQRLALLSMPKEGAADAD